MLKSAGNINDKGNGYKRFHLFVMAVFADKSKVINLNDKSIRTISLPNTFKESIKKDFLLQIIIAHAIIELEGVNIMLSKENEIDNKMKQLKELRASLTEKEVLLTEEFNEDPAAFYNDYTKVDEMNNILKQIEKCDKDIAKLEKMKVTLIGKPTKR